MDNRCCMGNPRAHVTALAASRDDSSISEKQVSHVLLQSLFPIWQSYFLSYVLYWQGRTFMQCQVMSSLHSITWCHRKVVWTF